MPFSSARVEERFVRVESVTGRNAQVYRVRAKGGKFNGCAIVTFGTAARGAAPASARVEGALRLGRVPSARVDDAFRAQEAAATRALARDGDELPGTRKTLTVRRSERRRKGEKGEDACRSGAESARRGALVPELAARRSGGARFDALNNRMYPHEAGGGVETGVDSALLTALSTRVEDSHSILSEAGGQYITPRDTGPRRAVRLQEAEDGLSAGP